MNSKKDRLIGETRYLSKSLTYSNSYLFCLKQTNKKKHAPGIITGNLVLGNINIPARQQALFDSDQTLVSCLLQCLQMASVEGIINVSSMPAYYPRFCVAASSSNRRNKKNSRPNFTKKKGFQAFFSF